jgi:hypothetical protein
MARGRGRGGRAGRGRGRGAGRGGNSRPPAPPAPTQALNPQLLEGAASHLANINDSPASRTRQQCLIAIHGGANAASQSLPRTTTDTDDSDNDIVDDELEDTPTRRRRQRREQLAMATNRARTATNNYMRQLFAANTGDNDNGNPDYNPLEEEPTPAPVLATRSPRQVQYGTNRVTSAGTNWLLEKCVKEDVFPKIKFAKLNGDLDFSNNPRSICRFMAQKMNVSDEDVESWWETSKETVHAKLKVNRNNAIKAIKTKFQGKKEVPSDST